MRRLAAATVVGVCVSVCWASTCPAVPKEEQSPERPMGLPLAGLTHIQGSDPLSQDFNDNLLGEALQIVEENLAEGVEYVARGLTRLDPDRLYLLHNSDRPVRIYFLNEGAGYRNTLGYSTTLAGSSVEGDRWIILPDVGTRRLGRTR